MCIRPHRGSSPGAFYPRRRQHPATTPAASRLLQKATVLKWLPPKMGLVDHLETGYLGRSNILPGRCVVPALLHAFPGRLSRWIYRLTMPSTFHCFWTVRLRSKALSDGTVSTFYFRGSLYFWLQPLYSSQLHS